jgi:hypothetical protein
MTLTADNNAKLPTGPASQLQQFNNDMSCSQDLYAGMHSTGILGDQAPTFRPHIS